MGFFAAEGDSRALLDWLFSELELRACEAYSEPDKLLRFFSSASDVAGALDLGKDAFGHGAAVHLVFWRPSIIPEPHVRRIDLNPISCEGASFRFAAEGNGLITLQLGGLSSRVLTRSVVLQNSVTRAKARGVESGVDWPRATKLWGKVAYHLRRRAAVASAAGCPVLREAYALAKSGYQLKQGARSTHAFQLTNVKGV